MRSLKISLIFIVASGLAACNPNGAADGNAQQGAAVVNENVTIQANQVELQQYGGTTSDAMTYETDGDSTATETENAVAQDLSIANAMDNAAIQEGDEREARP